MSAAPPSASCPTSRTARARTAALAVATLLAAACGGGDVRIYEDAEVDGGQDPGTLCHASAGPCQVAQLDAASGACLLATVADGTACDDHNACTQRDSCAAGTCVGSVPLVCTGRTACATVATCAPATGCPTPTSPCTSPAATVLRGCSASYYVADISVGGTTLPVDLDTGSTSLGIAANTCTSCGVTPTYTPGAAAQATGQSSGSTYADGSSWSGPVYRDQVVLDGSPMVTTKFVAISRQSGFFGGTGCPTTAAGDPVRHGILGLGPSALEEAGTDGFVPDFAAQTMGLPTFAFQLCDTGGNFWLGGFDPNHAAAPLQYTPMQVAAGGQLTFAVTLVDLAVAGTSLGLASSALSPALPDSGTTIWVLPSAAYSAVVNAIEASAAFQAAFGRSFFGGSGGCAAPSNAMTRAQLDQSLPAVSVTFPLAGGTAGASFTLTLPPTQSYLSVDPTAPAGSPRYCPALAQGSLMVLGDSFLRAVVAVFVTDLGQLGLALQRGCAS